MITKPTPDYITRRIAEFDGDLKYSGSERAVELVFSQWPLNNNYQEVLVKVVVLNQLYSTNIYNPDSVAQRILEICIDDRLLEGDDDLVQQIAYVRFKSKTWNLLSFASKYCSWHQPELFQIYDSYVDKLIWVYKSQFQFAKFKRKELREYPKFVRIIRQLQGHFGLQSFTKKQMDKFLWIEGKRQLIS